MANTAQAMKAMDEAIKATTIKTGKYLTFPWKPEN